MAKQYLASVYSRKKRVRTENLRFEKLVGLAWGFVIYLMLNPVYTRVYIYIYIYIYNFRVIPKTQNGTWFFFAKHSALSYLPTPLLGQNMTQGQFFKQSLTGLNSEFSFSLTSCLNKADHPSLSYYLPIAGGTIIGLIPFPRVLVLCEMQSISSWIWTRVAGPFPTTITITPRAPPKHSALWGTDQG